MGARVDVPVLGGHDHVVGAVRSGPADQIGDPGRHLGGAGHGQAAAFAEVVLDVDDQKRPGGGTSSHKSDSMTPAAARAPGRATTMGSHGAADHPSAGASSHDGSKLPAPASRPAGDLRRLRETRPVTGRNRLAQETSPYLRQHADNPVDWYPWGEEAFDRARTEDKPVFLSVGYSACHWCHVMAHECFEDEATAALMNELFVNIKVDREERPDVDAVYMDAVQSMTGSRWLAHDGVPGAGRPAVLRRDLLPARTAFTELLRQVATVWRERRDELEGQADQLAEAVRRHAGFASDGPANSRWRPSPGLLDGGYHALRNAHDPEWGGFGRAPKFPQPAMIELVLRGGPAAGRGAACWTWPRPRSTPWPQAASTTTWAAGSPGTRPTGPGWSRTSRRCCTTTPCSAGSTCTPGRSRVRPGTCRWSTRPSATCWPRRCGRRRGVSTRRRTPTARAWRAVSTCGRRRRCAPPGASLRSGGTA